MFNNLIKGSLSLDIEFGNSQGFYSGKKSQSLPYHNGDSSSLNSWYWEGAVGRKIISISESWKLEQNEVQRDIEFCPQSDTELYDLVSRFVVESVSSKSACIANKYFEHTSKNIYYQFEDFGDVIIPVSDSQYLKFSSLGCDVPEGFQEVFYIRDESENNDVKRWVVHHRLIVKLPDANLIVRSCNPRYEGPLPCQNLIPWFVKKLFFRIRESKYPSFPLMSVGEVLLPSKSVAKISTKITLHEY